MSEEGQCLVEFFRRVLGHVRITGLKEKALKDRLAEEGVFIRLPGSKRELNWLKGSKTC